MKILIINTRLNYPGWSEGKLNLIFSDYRFSVRGSLRRLLHHGQIFCAMKPLAERIDALPVAF
jgi:hypothetical protein